MRAGRALLALGLWCAVTAAAAPGERDRFLAQGEASLARGDAASALRAFERAASISHAADAEMGLVRAYMQGGEYRRALAFVAHTAAAHREVPGSATLYAWLLHVGGQTGHAVRVLDEALLRFPADPVVALARRHVHGGDPQSSEALLDASVRLAPYGTNAGIPTNARAVGSGMLVDRGHRAVVPLATLAGARQAWIRNGMGQVSSARVERRVTSEGLAVLKLDPPLPFDAHTAVVPRGAFPGSVAYCVEFPPARDGRPRWPVLSAGFLGASLDHGDRALGIELAPGPRGGPVFDAGGRLAGMALSGGLGPDRFVPAARLLASLGEMLGAQASAAPVARAPLDLVYESALRTAVQVIAAR